MMDVIVIGAGWSGLTAAARLAASGYSVVVLEKSRGPGGRSATRREGGFVFDHGAQYLTARSEAFARQVRAWSDAGLLAAWQPELAVIGRRPDDAGETPANRWVGVGGMNAVPHRLAEGLDCRWRWRAEQIDFDGGRWRVRSADRGALTGQALLLTAPPAQSARLLGPDHPLSRQLDDIEMLPCWTVMAGFEAAPDVGFDAAFVNEGPLSWVARNDSKAGSRSGPAWTAHATPEWSGQHLELDFPTAASRLFEAMGQLAPAFRMHPDLCIAHRWRFAMAGKALEGPVLADDSQKLIVAGDWCAGERIEGAWISGLSAARRVQSLL